MKLNQHFKWSEPASVFCENRSDMSQPINTISSISLVIASLFLLKKREKDGSEKRVDLILLSVVCVCTFLMHKYPDQRLTAALDGISMYMLMTYLISKSILKETKRIYVPFVTLFLCLLFPNLLHMKIATLLSFVWIVSVLLEINQTSCQEESDKKKVGLFMFALAYLAWVLDRKRVICNPSSLFQLHAVWHVFASIGFYMIL